MDDLNDLIIDKNTEQKQIKFETTNNLLSIVNKLDSKTPKAVKTSLKTKHRFSINIIEEINENQDRIKELNTNKIEFIESNENNDSTKNENNENKDVKDIKDDNVKKEITRKNFTHNERKLNLQ